MPCLVRVHVVTVNEYDRSGMQQKWENYSWLGLSVGINLAAKISAEKNYLCDITYSTTQELVSTLRDNMVVRAENMVQRPLNYTWSMSELHLDWRKRVLRWSFLVGAASDTSNLSHGGCPKTTEDNYIIDVRLKPSRFCLIQESIKRSTLIWKLVRCENVALFTLSTTPFIQLHHDFGYRLCGRRIKKSWSSTNLLKSDHGRTSLFTVDFANDWSQRRCSVQEETKKHLRRLPANLFRMQRSCQGWQGRENRRRNSVKFITFAWFNSASIARIDHQTFSTPSLKSEFKAVVEDVKSLVMKKGSSHVGTVARWNQWLPFSIVGSRSRCPTKFWMKNHYKEAQIIMNAGQRGAVTIATNMAGRGTDIKAWWRCATRWLCVIRTNVTGVVRSITSFVDVRGRQGIPGESQFYPVTRSWRRFGSERIQASAWSLQVERRKSVIRSNMFTSGRGAQKRVEEQLRYP